MKSREIEGKIKEKLDKKKFEDATIHILEEAALKYCPDNYEKFLKELQKSPFKELFDEPEKDSY